MPLTTPARARKMCRAVLLSHSLLLVASCGGRVSGADAAAKSPQDPPTPEILLKVDNGLALAEGDYFTDALNAARPYADKGYATSQRVVGVLYLYGKGVASDQDEAAKWLRLAASQGDEEAACLVSKIASQAAAAWTVGEALNCRASSHAAVTGASVATSFAGTPPSDDDGFGRWAAQIAAANGGLSLNEYAALARAYAAAHGGGPSAQSGDDPRISPPSSSVPSVGYSAPRMPSSPNSTAQPRRSLLDEPSASSKYSFPPIGSDSFGTTVVLNRAGPGVYMGTNGRTYTDAGPHGVVDAETGQFYPR